MAWNDNLSTEQEEVAGYTGTHARLLAGPGTGKTRVITQRVVYLIDEMGVDPDDIVALTFTRAAASELKERVAEAVIEDSGEDSEDSLPRISTLHSFALRHLLRNSERLQRLPQPVRIAGDWEERHIVLEDLKSQLDHDRINETRKLKNRLAADWQTLSAQEDNYTADPEFLGAWQEHRERYGYTLRSELIYQLKRALEETGDLDLEDPIRYLIVDEYQDLNRSELAVIDTIAERGAEVFAAGDDDQSIYGFREAEPAGIRQFTTDFNPAEDLRLEVCFRCDQEILDLAEFVADLDPRREPKNIYPDEDSGDGEVNLLRFDEQYKEAESIARICGKLCRNNHDPGEILILLRGDKHGAFSDPIISALQNENVPVATEAVEDPLSTQEAEQVMALLRLGVNENDSLAWRTLIETRNNGIGNKAVEAITNICRQEGDRFSTSLLQIAENPSKLSQFGGRIEQEVTEILGLLENQQEGLSAEDEGRERFLQSLRDLVDFVVDDENVGGDIFDRLSEISEKSGISSGAELIGLIESSDDSIEQDLSSEKVNVITMHQAKGLTSGTVFVAGVEDERIPGRAEGRAVDDERRLLYVSMTRAKHRLFLTFCNRRVGHQMNFGTEKDSPFRNLTGFLRDVPIQPIDGENFSENYEI